METLEKERMFRRQAARIGGAALLLMAIAASFSYGFVHESLTGHGDASATWNHLRSANLLFKSEITGWILILICDIVAAWAIYVVLKPVHEALALLGAWFRLTYAAILGVSVLNLLFVSLLSGSPEKFAGLGQGQLPAFTVLFLDAFESVWSAGLIIFGGHLLIVGYVAYSSNHIPKIISILLLLASAGYILIHLASIFLSASDPIVAVMEYIFKVPMICGELGFGLWLLFRGGKMTAKN